MSEANNNTAVDIVDGMESLEVRLQQIREAQAKFATYTQEQVDAIFRAAVFSAALFFQHLTASCNPCIIEITAINEHSCESAQFFVSYRRLRGGAFA